MSRQMQQGQKLSVPDKHDTVKPLPIYDKFSHEFSNQIAKVRSEIVYTNDKLKKVSINIYRKFKIVLSSNVMIDNETFNLGEMLSRLQKEAVNNIRTIEWPKDDVFFTICRIQRLKEHGVKILKDLEIVLTDPIETILDGKRKEHLLRVYHNDS